MSQYISTVAKAKLFFQIPLESKRKDVQPLLFLVFVSVSSCILQAMYRSKKEGAVNKLSDTSCETQGGHKLAIQVAILKGLRDSFNGQYNSDLMA